MKKSFIIVKSDYIAFKNSYYREWDGDKQDFTYTKYDAKRYQTESQALERIEFLIELNGRLLDGVQAVYSVETIYHS